MLLILHSDNFSGNFFQRMEFFNRNKPFAGQTQTSILKSAIRFRPKRLIYTECTEGWKEGTLTRAPNHWGRRKVSTLSQVLSSIHLLPKDLSSNMEAPSRQNYFLPRAPSNLGTPLDLQTINWSEKCSLLYILHNKQRYYNKVNRDVT